jgi:hypothetical protein
MGAGASAGAQLTTFIYLAGTGYADLSQSTASSNRLRQWNVVDVFTLGLGRHQLKVGVDYRRIASPANPASPLIAAGYFSAPQVLCNEPSSLGVLWYPGTLPRG